MLFTIAMMLLIFTGNLSANDYEFEGDIYFNKLYTFVSLGCNCWQAQALRDSKAHFLRDAAFPFDWLFSLNNDGLVKCLDEDFKNFFNESYFVRYGHIYLENTYYNFKFTHDWPYQDTHVNESRYAGQLEFIKTKYTRRINRFKSLHAFTGKVFFVRCFQTNPNYVGEPGWNAQNARNLDEALKRFFPNLNFTLVVVSCTDPTVSEIGNIDGIREYKIADLTNNNFAAYSTMYKELLAEYI